MNKMMIYIPAMLILSFSLFAGGKERMSCEPDFMIVEQTDKPGPGLAVKNSLYYTEDAGIIERTRCLGDKANYNHACGYHWYVHLWKNNQRCESYPINVECQRDGFFTTPCGKLFRALTDTIRNSPVYYEYQLHVPVAWDSDDLIAVIQGLGFIPLIHYEKNNHWPHVRIKKEISRSLEIGSIGALLGANGAEGEIDSLFYKLYGKIEPFVDQKLKIGGLGMSAGNSMQTIHKTQELILKKGCDIAAFKRIIAENGFTIDRENIPEYLSLNFICKINNLEKVEGMVRKKIPGMLKLRAWL